MSLALLFHYLMLNMLVSNVPGIIRTHVRTMFNIPVSPKGPSIEKRLCFRKDSEFKRSATEESEVLPWSCHCAPLFLGNTALLCDLVSHYREYRRAITGYQVLAYYVNIKT